MPSFTVYDDDVYLRKEVFTVQILRESISVHVVREDSVSIPGLISVVHVERMGTAECGSVFRLMFSALRKTDEA